MSTSSRLPWGTSPSLSSDAPYESAVSNRLMPWSSAACTTPRHCSRSNFNPKLFVPRPTTETASPESPSRRSEGDAVTPPTVASRCSRMVSPLVLSLCNRCGAVGRPLGAATRRPNRSQTLPYWTMDIAGIWEPLPGYFNTASYGLPPRAAIDAMETVLADWRVGRTSFERWESSVVASRACFARLVNVPPTDVAIGAAVSEQFGLVATALPDRAKVLVPEGEFTSVVFPWAVHEDRGVELIVAPVAKLAEAIASSTPPVAF